MVANANLTKFETSRLPEVLSSMIEGLSGSGYTPPGRIAQVLDGAGKRRLFDIISYIKQRLLRPVHDWAMSVLRTIPTDGTFAQMGPIRRLQKLPGLKDIDSYDLKSATDRWPLSFIHEVVAIFFGLTVASCIVNVG